MILRLDTDELLSALDAIDPVDALIEELAGRACDDVGPSSPEGRLTPWRGGGPADAPATDLVLLEDPRAGSDCVLPASALRGFRTAALATLAGRTFVTPGVVTAAVLGSGLAAQVSLTLIARYLSGLSHVAVCPTGDEPDGPLQPRVIDRLDLAGVGWSVAPAAAEAVFGATLVVAAIAGAPWPEIGRLPKGAVLVNTTGEDLPDDLVDAVDQVYVDDAALIGAVPHRYFARMHRAGLNAGPAWSAWTEQRHRRIEADFAQVLTGAHAGRTHVDHILLVELLSANALDVRLACLLHGAALEHGLGRRLVE